MSFWSTIAPVATIGASALGTPAAGMAVGALTGGLAAREKRNEELARQQRTANAAADAIGVSWGRRDGVGSIPQVEYAQGTDAGNMAAGVTGGLMSGYSAGQNYKNLFGSPGDAMGGQQKSGLLGVNTDLGAPKELGPNYDFLKKNQNLYSSNTPSFSFNPKYLGGG